MVHVRPLFRVVANGGRAGTALKLTLIATPAKTDEASGFPFDDWPLHVAGLLTQELRFAKAEGLAKPRVDGGQKVSATAFGLHQIEAAELKAVNALWQRLMFLDVSDWDALAEDINRSLTGQKHQAALDPPYTTKDAAPLLDPEDGAILAARPQAGDMATIRGALSLAQADLATDMDTVRAARLLAKMQHGPYWLEPEDDQSTSVKPPKERYLYAVDQTRDAAKRSAAYFGWVKQILGTPDVDVAAPAPFPGVAIVPDPKQVIEGKTGCALRASHDYGTWLQRRPDVQWMPEPSDPKKMRPPKAPDEAVPASDSVSRARSIFFALQSDPLLARLFGFAIDVEITAEHAKALPSGALHLWVAPAAAESDLPTVVTTARLDAEGFWPCSIFDPDLGHRPALVEQRHGVWCFGQGYDTQDDAARYQLASIDIRHAANTEDNGKDQGERHRTAGFTIMDRGRANQVARDMALAQYNSNVGHDGVVVLHAEELTIGRRVDVAAVAPGSKLSTVTSWRSLMSRLTTFAFPGHSEVIEQALRHVLRAVKGTQAHLDDGYFQVSARYLPVPPPTEGGTGRYYEAVAEEAVFLWDGTPAGALTDARPDAKAGSQPPFERRYQLPTRYMHRELRPAPLRFTVPYLFGWRSIFLGGGGPTAIEAETFRQLHGDTMLPPAVGDRAAPRRFLRHEGIAAPTLLMTTKGVTARHGKDGIMGFEPIDQAIVRSALAAPKDAPVPVPDSERSAEPIPPAADRAAPHATVRVFVAPEVALEVVARHGALDTGEPGAILAGGLRDVTFAPRVETRRGYRVRGGFPAFVTRTLPAFGDEPAAYVREPATQADLDDEQAGVSVFQPQGRNTAGTKPGYLPDPAAQSFLVRARRRTSDAYLDGYRLAALYDPPRSVYPHALPLVIKLVRVAGLRAEPVARIETISKPTVLTCMDGDETVPSRHGTRVQLIEFQLMENEDFDLEVACLPSPDILADSFAVTETIALQLRRAADDPAARARLEKLLGTVPVADGAPDTVLTGVGGERLESMASVKRVADLLLDAMQTRWPLEELAALATLRICHAANRPAVGPDGRPPIDWSPASPPRVSPRTGQEPGASSILLGGKLLVDLDQVGAFEIVAETVGTSGPMDDRSRSRSRVAKRAGRWPEVTVVGGGTQVMSNRDVLGFDVAADGQVTLPQQHVVLLRVDNLPTHGTKPRTMAGTSPEKTEKLFGPTDGRWTELDLEVLHQSALRSKPIAYTIGSPAAANGAWRTRSIQVGQPQLLTDNKARSLKLSIVALARHAGVFETAPVYAPKQNTLLQRRKPLLPVEQAIDGPVQTAWMRSTARPTAPAAFRPEPSFVITRSIAGSSAKPTHTLIRHALTRLYFNREWFSSGQDERLGVVFWPPNYFERDEHGKFTLTDDSIDKDRVRIDGRVATIRQFADQDLGAAGAYITRWGGDPIKKDLGAQQGFLIPPAAFFGASAACHCDGLSAAPEIVHRALLPVPSAKMSELDLPSDSAKDQTLPTEFLPVALLSYEPRFDRDRELWYVDVAVDPTRAVEPFVRFGLVCYQPNADGAELQLSRPVVVATPVLPDRTVELCTWETDGAQAKDLNLTVTVKGRGFRDIKDIDPAAAFRGRAPGDVEKARAQFDSLRRPVMSVRLFHETMGQTMLRTPIEAAAEIEVSVAGEELRWKSGTVKIPAAERARLGTGRYVCYVEEVERRMPATYQSEPIDPTAMFDSGSFVLSGPRFAGRIPFFSG